MIAPLYINSRGDIPLPPLAVSAPKCQCKYLLRNFVAHCYLVGGIDLDNQIIIYDKGIHYIMQKPSYTLLKINANKSHYTSKIQFFSKIHTITNE